MLLMQGIHKVQSCMWLHAHIHFEANYHLACAWPHLDLKTLAESRPLTT